MFIKMVLIILHILNYIVLNILIEIIKLEFNSIFLDNTQYRPILLITVYTLYMVNENYELLILDKGP